VILLDLAIYLQHMLLHAVPALWQLHPMHHADLKFDVTTGARFHPIEILPSMGSKLGVVAALGTPAAAVLIFEVLLNATSITPLRLPYTPEDQAEQDDNNEHQAHVGDQWGRCLYRWRCNNLEQLAD
jgi:Fatty acid hydroxylase